MFPPPYISGLLNCFSKTFKRKTTLGLKFDQISPLVCFGGDISEEINKPSKFLEYCILAVKSSVIPY